jgi:predicted neuraminidase
VLFPLYHEAEYCPYLFLVDDLEDPRAGTLVAETMARKKAIQPAICRADKQCLLMLCRTNQGRIWRSLSFNDGLSWSILRPTELPNPDSAVDVTSWRGVLLLCYNPSESRRNELRLAISRDRGESWRDIATLAKGDVEYSYPCLYVDEDESLHVTFTDHRYAIRHLPLRAPRLAALIEEEKS